MIGEFTLWNPKLTTDRNSIIEIPEAIKGKIAARVKAADEAWGFDCSKKYHSLNNYENDDYLFVADMLLDICELHRTMHFHPIENKWVKGCTAIPHIHLEFVEEPVLKKDDNGQILTDDDGNYVVDDAKINMGVRPPKENGAHVLRFNYYWIKQYLSFLIGVFDDNAEWTVSLPEVNVEENMTYGSIDELNTTAANLQKMGLWQQAQRRLHPCIKTTKRTPGPSTVPRD